MKAPINIAVGLLVLLASPAQAQEVKLSARVEPPAVTIGTPFRYTVEIDAPKDVELVIPLLGERFGDFSVTDFGDEPPREDKGRVRVVRWFELVGYAVGEKTLPPYPLKYRAPGGEQQDAEAKEVTVIVRSLLPVEPTPFDIRDIAEPEALPFDWKPVLIGSGLVAVLLGVLALVYFLATRRRAAAVVAGPKAHEVALQALARLLARRLLEVGRYEEYYVELSSIVRDYVERRFGLHAPEMTTEEFLVAMQRDRRLTPEHRGLLGEFLTESDLVKFARHLPTTEQGERGYEAARRFVEESREDGAGRVGDAALGPMSGGGPAPTGSSFEGRDASA